RRLRQRARAARCYALFRRPCRPSRCFHDRAAGRAPRGSGIERRGQDHPVQLHHRRLSAILGNDPLLRRGRDGLSPAGANPSRIAPDLPDFRSFSRLSVLDNVYLACRGVSRGRYSFIRPRRNDALVHAAENLIQAVHLTAIKDRFVADLAYGQQRQLEIALALAGAPRLILFDEPAAGLSPAERAELIEILSSLPAHIGYIIIEHDMDVALRVVERVTMMHNGRIFKEGGPQEIEA